MRARRAHLCYVAGWQGHGCPPPVCGSCVGLPRGMGAGVSSICDGAVRAACKRDTVGGRPPAIPSPAHSPGLRSGPGAARLPSGCEGWQAAGPSAVGGSCEGWQAAGPSAEGGSSGSGTVPAAVEHRPPASQSCPAEGSLDSHVFCGSGGPGARCRPPAILSGLAEGSWDPFDGIGFDVVELQGHGFGLGASAKPCMWCDFCGLPLQRSVRVVASRLTGDTAACEVGPPAASVAVCECGEGFA